MVKSVEVSILKINAGRYFLQCAAESTKCYKLYHGPSQPCCAGGFESYWYVMVIYNDQWYHCVLSSKDLKLNYLSYVV